jgi:hypothetical protein
VGVRPVIFTAWMVTLNGWLFTLGAVLALAGVVLFALVIKDEVGYAKDRRMDRKRRAARSR